MKSDQFINETTSGSVASVSMPLGVTQKRAKESVEVKGLKPVDKLAKAKKKGPYANSIVEGIETKKVSEAELQEDDLIIIPGNSKKRKTGFVPKGQSRVDHEVEMARSDLVAAFKNAKAIYQILKDRSEEEGIEGWVQEKLIKANDYLNAVKEYYDEKMMQEMSGGVIAAGGVGESWRDDKFADNDLLRSPSMMPKYNYNFKTPEPKSREELLSRLKELEAEFDPAYQQSDDYGFWSKQNKIQSEIVSIKRQLEKQGVAEGTEDPSWKKGWELCNKDPSADVGFYLKKHGDKILDRREFIQGFNANAKSRGMRQYGDWGGHGVNPDLIRYKEIMRDRGVAEGSLNEFSSDSEDDGYYKEYLRGYKDGKGYPEVVKSSKKREIWMTVTPKNPPLTEPYMRGWYDGKYGPAPGKDLIDLNKLNEQGVAEGLGDVVKGIKRKVAGKEDPKDVEHTYGRIARSAIKHKTPDQAEKDIKRWEKVNKVVNKEGVAEEIKGWKHAGRDLAQHRASLGKDVHLVLLKKDGTESKMNDAKKSFRSEDEARQYHERIKKLNPTRNIRHNLYVGDNVEKLD